MVISPHHRNIISEIMGLFSKLSISLCFEKNSCAKIFKSCLGGYVFARTSLYFRVMNERQTDPENL